MLLDLPSELLQLILRHCCTSAYIQAAQSCRALYIAASTSRGLVLHHLRTNPGPGFRDHDGSKSNEDGTDGKRLTTRELFLLLRRGGVEHLLDGSLNADVTRYTFNGKVIETPASSMCSAKSQTAFLLVFKGDDRIFHCPVSADGQISIESARPCSDVVPSAGRLRIIKTCYTKDIKNLVAVIVRGEEMGSLPSASQANDIDSVPAFFNEELNRALQQYCDSYVLLFMDPTTAERPRAVCEFGHENNNVVALAAKSPLDFAISWEKIDGTGHSVSVHRSYFDREKNHPTYHNGAYSYTECVTLDQRGLWTQRRGLPTISHHHEVSNLGAVAGLKYNDWNQLLYSHRGSTIFGYYHNLAYRQEDNGVCSVVGSTAHKNYTSVAMPCQGMPAVMEDTMTFAVDPPFYGLHETYETTSNDHNGNAANTMRCRITYLAYALGDAPCGGHTIAALLIRHVDVAAETCDHEVRAESGRRGPGIWHAVAMLCDHPEMPPSTIGCIFASSPQGNRVAVASWDTLYIWALNPEEVTRGADSNYYPKTWQWQSEGNLVALRPVVICMNAVCFKLMFSENGNVLVALTDRGLMTWDLGPHSRGRRKTENLDADAAPIPKYEHSETSIGHLSYPSDNDEDNMEEEEQEEQEEEEDEDEDEGMAVN